MRQAEINKKRCPDRFKPVCCGTVRPDEWGSRASFYQQLSLLILFFLFIGGGVATAQSPVVDKKSFFADEQLVEMTLVTDLKKLIMEKGKSGFEHNIQPATITFLLPDSTKVTEEVEIRPRGEFRREECYLPPIMINFKASKGGMLKKLGRLKFVWPCDNSLYNEQLVLKEYLLYKIYNLFTEKSFRVRLVKVKYHDVKERMSPHKYYAFFIEDVDDMAKRNDCVEIESLQVHTERTNREHTTLLALFQYMIGNTDWSIFGCHNIKLIRSRDDSLSRPFAVPYDFDCNGSVNADYSFPAPELELTSVRQRLYRGYARSMDELKSALKVLHGQRDAIDSLIINFRPLTLKNRKEMISYLEGFYNETKEDKDIKELFIYKARRE